MNPVKGSMLNAQYKPIAIFMDSLVYYNTFYVDIYYNFS